MLNTLKRALFVATLAVSGILSTAPATTHAASTVPEFDVTMPTQVAVGATFNMTVALNTNTTKVTGWQFGFDYDPTLLQITTTSSSTPPSVGTFSTFWSDQANLHNASSSNVNFKLTQDGVSTSPGNVRPGGQVLLGQNTGDGIVGTSSSVVVTFTFTGLANGVAAISFRNLVVDDVNAMAIPGVTVNPSTPSITVGIAPHPVLTNQATTGVAGNLSHFTVGFVVDNTTGTAATTAGSATVSITDGNATPASLAVAVPVVSAGTKSAVLSSGQFALLSGMTTTTAQIALSGATTVSTSYSFTGPIPSARSDAAWGYDPTSKRMVLFGGFTPGPTALGDTWTWNGTWARRTPSVAPSARDGMEIVTDTALNALLMYGSRQNNTETWTYKNGTWTRLAPAHNPGPRLDEGLAYDGNASKVVLFSGSTTNDTWQFNGNDWVQLTPAASPPARTEPGMVYDPATKQTVLFGGTVSDLQSLGDTWTWNGTTWTKRTTPTAMGLRAGAAMVYDPAHKTVVLFGGYDWHNAITHTDTWVWNGSAWTQAHPTVSPPAASAYRGRLGYDAATKQIVLFGGNPSNQLWAWDGTNWKQL